MHSTVLRANSSAPRHGSDGARPHTCFAEHQPHARSGHLLGMRCAGSPQGWSALLERPITSPPSCCWQTSHTWGTPWEAGKPTVLVAGKAP